MQELWFHGINADENKKKAEEGDDKKRPKVVSSLSWILLLCELGAHAKI